MADGALSGDALTSYIAEGARARNLDPKAVLAVAKSEGLSGGIGDGGHAFGPFQLNDAGGVLTGKFPTLSAEQKQAWASSPAGLDYALDGIAKVAAGLTGIPAIQNIVARFERPANISGEVKRAVGYYAGIGAPGDLRPGVLGGVNDAARHIPGVAQAEGAVSAVTDVGHFLGRLTDPNFILRGLQIVAGAVLAFAGLFLLARQIGLASPSVPGPSAAVASAVA